MRDSRSHPGSRRPLVFGATLGLEGLETGRGLVSLLPARAAAIFSNARAILPEGF